MADSENPVSITAPFKSTLPIHGLGLIAAIGFVALGAVSSTHITPHARLPLYFAALTTTWAACLAMGWFLPKSLSTNDSPHPEFPQSLQIILLWGVAFRLFAFVGSPIMEDDYYRYLWDGRQMVQSGNPYLHPPSHFFEDPQLGPTFDGILERVNYPHVPTIYAPVLQYAFGLSYLLGPGMLWPWKLILLLADFAIAFCLWKNRNLRALALYAWCPIVIQENGFTAHPDLLGAAFVMLSFLAQSNQRTAWSGIALGLAAATKVTGFLFWPFLLPLRSWKGWLSAILTYTALYLPFWIQGSTADWNGLAQFAREWEFNSAGFALLKAILNPNNARFEALWITVCGLALLWWMHRQKPNSPPRGDWIIGWFFLWSSVIQPWYLLWAVPWILMRPTYTGFTALIAVSLSYIIPLHTGQSTTDLFAHPEWVRPLEFGTILIAFLLDLLPKLLPAKKSDPATLLP